MNCCLIFLHQDADGVDGYLFKPRGMAAAQK